MGIDRLQTVWVRAREGRKGALIGALTGGSLSGLFVAFLATALCEVDCNNAPLEGFVAGGAQGALLGAFGGFVVGSFITSWRPLWDRIVGLWQW